MGLRNGVNELGVLSHISVFLIGRVNFYAPYGMKLYG